MRQLRFQENDRVRVMRNNPDSPTKRTPYYVRGKIGTVKHRYGTAVDPEFDNDHRVSWGPLYTIAFDWSELYGADRQNTKIYVDLHESWLVPE